MYLRAVRSNSAARQGPTNTGRSGSRPLGPSQKGDSARAGRQDMLTAYGCWSHFHMHRNTSGGIQPHDKYYLFKTTTKQTKHKRLIHTTYRQASSREKKTGNLLPYPPTHPSYRFPLTQRDRQTTRQAAYDIIHTVTAKFESTQRERWCKKKETEGRKTGKVHLGQHNTPSVRPFHSLQQKSR